MDLNSLIIEENWTVNEGVYHNNPIIIRLNTWCEKIIEKRLFLYRMGIAIPFAETKNNLKLNIKETEDFYMIEDDIFEIFQKDNFSVVCGIITTCKMREFLIYLSCNKNIQSKIDQLKAKYNKYDFQYYIEDDPTWDVYTNFLKKEK